MIKEEKEIYRDLSARLRVDGKQDMKVFEKFVNVHDEKLVLKKQAIHEVSSPTSRIKVSVGGGAVGTDSSVTKILTPK